jgi:hypothetical protein
MFWYVFFAIMYVPTTSEVATVTDLKRIMMNVWWTLT